MLKFGKKSGALLTQILFNNTKLNKNNHYIKTIISLKRYFRIITGPLASDNLNINSIDKDKKKKIILDNFKNNDTTGINTDHSDSLADIYYLQGDSTPDTLIRRGNFLHTTTAARQLDTMKLYNELRANNFTPLQSKTIIKMLIDTLNTQFYSIYNYKYVRSMELVNLKYSYQKISNDLKFEIKNLQDSHFLKTRINILNLDEVLKTWDDELNQLVIESLKNECRIEFQNHKLENTLLNRQQNLLLKGLHNKIGTHLIGQIKSETEQLRWYTMKYGVLALVSLVVMIVCGANISKWIESNTQSSKSKELVLKTVSKEGGVDPDNVNTVNLLDTNSPVVTDQEEVVQLLDNNK
ncbi:uncharacterized protein SCODWIG_02549 [Saccharomycodes ludwigii]|uniref:Uncharacterized protein n=1 Tax=Saccharomycodes ludwigii TaxID=36035 RepID=A0A376B7Y0_9ASCO|nr:hypothetical protein SCDLUD_000889 [Saccharomycodes ludwigii]KAH3903266.1 hypothetical protein SCDLUD_000889 [Saccharomycodes ludwigii]SSD60788.1 uncharacterized protein SCODWIG_02549 [Saccharomycodes ludwigii]